MPEELSYSMVVHSAVHLVLRYPHRCTEGTMKAVDISIYIVKLCVDDRVVYEIFMAKPNMRSKELRVNMTPERT